MTVEELIGYLQAAEKPDAQVLVWPQWAEEPWQGEFTEPGVVRLEYDGESNVVGLRLEP